MQHVGVDLNGSEIGAVFLTQPRWTRLQFKLPPGIIRDENTLSLRLSNAHRPPASGDTRLLGVAIRQFALTSAPDAGSCRSRRFAGDGQSDRRRAISPPGRPRRRYPGNPARRAWSRVVT